MQDLTPGQIIDGMSEKNRLLTAKNEEYKELIEKRAQAERAYNIAFAKEALNQKSHGQPISIIDKLVRGDKVVADLKYDLDVAEGVCKACLMQIKALTIAIDTYRSLLAWQKAELLRTE